MGCREGIAGERPVLVQVKWEQGAVIENYKVKLCWNFEYQMRKEITAQRPDVTIEYNDCKTI